MKMTSMIAALPLIALVGIANPASAQTENRSGGIYVSALAGVVTPDEQRIVGANAAGAPRRIVTDMKSGTALGVAVGYATRDANWGRLRGELEFGQLTAELKALSLNEVDRALISTPDKEVTTNMVNIFYDTPTFFGPIRAEFGAGIGNSKINYNINYNVTATGPAIEIPTNSSQGAQQFMVGLSGRVLDGLEVFARFTQLTLEDHKVERFNRTAGVLDSTLDAEYEAQTISIGARYVF